MKQVHSLWPSSYILGFPRHVSLGTIDPTGGSCLDLQPGEVCTVYCQGPNYFGDQLGAGCPATNLDPTKVINWLPPSCYCREPVPPPAGYLLGSAPNTYTCAPGYYGRANYRCVVDTTTCEPIITMTGCNLLAQCTKPRVPWREATWGCHIGTRNLIKF